MTEVWDKKWPAADNFVDSMIKTYKNEANNPPVTYEALDIVFRPYLYWLYSAQDNKVHPELTHLTLARLLAIMMLEGSVRLKVTKEDGEVMSTPEWLQDLMSDVSGELEFYLNNMLRTQGNA